MRFPHPLSLLLALTALHLSEAMVFELANPAATTGQDLLTMLAPHVGVVDQHIPRASLRDMEFRVAHVLRTPGQTLLPPPIGHLAMLFFAVTTAATAVTTAAEAPAVAQAAAAAEMAREVRALLVYYLQQLRVGWPNYNNDPNHASAQRRVVFLHLLRSLVRIYARRAPVPRTLHDDTDSGLLHTPLVDPYNADLMTAQQHAYFLLHHVYAVEIDEPGTQPIATLSGIIREVNPWWGIKQWRKVQNGLSRFASGCRSCAWAVAQRIGRRPPLRIENA